MSQAQAELVLLIECGDAVETAAVKSLLDGAGIHYVVQGEQHASLLGGLAGNVVIMPRVLVSSDQLERAQALLAARPVLDRTAPDGQASLEDAVCPVHEQPAVAACSRCGSFLCARCGSLGAPPVCEDCLARAEPPLRPSRRAVTVRWLLGAGVVMVMIAMAAWAADSCGA